MNKELITITLASLYCELPSDKSVVIGNTIRRGTRRGKLMSQHSALCTTLARPRWNGRLQSLQSYKRALMRLDESVFTSILKDKHYLVFYDDDCVNGVSQVVGEVLQERFNVRIETMEAEGPTNKLNQLQLAVLID